MTDKEPEEPTETAHWEQRLVRGFSGPDTVSLDVDPDHDGGAMILLASRIQGLHDALKQRRDPETGADPLAEEEPADLLRLLDHLHRVTTALVNQEDRVIEALAGHVSARRIAAAMEVDHKTVANRFKRIERAKVLDVATLALTEREADDGTSTDVDEQD